MVEPNSRSFIEEEDFSEKMVLYGTLTVLTLMSFGLSAPPVESDLAGYGLENYDVYSNTWDLDSYGETYDYDDLDEEIEVGTLAPPPSVTQPPATVPPEDYVEEVTLPPHPKMSPATLDFCGPGLFGPDTGLGMPSCLLCVCVSVAVYTAMTQS
ncbi:opticin-like [Myxocyprinus asiaticus]|uniref:opticin-like n=1 Tax=Myxocyprinus asiaticus TaxID=70543 RepID=UPI002223AF36|nr:opticin-like [Myxocyprinus asiaticus]